MFKIALDAGHGMNTAGKRCASALDPKETREWYLNSRICEKIMHKLKEYEGYELLRVDDITGATDVPLRTRTNRANAWGADFYLSIHHNAGVNGGTGGGIVSIVYNKTTNAKTLEWQKELYNSLIKHTGLRGNRATPLAKMNLHVCRETKMPAVLVELGFMDSAVDVPVILTDDFAEKCANAIVEVIVAKAELKSAMSDIEYVQKACGLSDSTVDYLCDYKYAVDLFRKLRNAMK